jgi:probable F420-dependent oxidoreductase, MSMEG_4141 family
VTAPCDPVAVAARLRRPGVWCFTDSLGASAAAEFACRVEELGYSALWLPETTGREPLTHIAHLLGHTSSLVMATGIASIYHRLPGTAVQAAHTLAEQSGGRFLLGLGVSHARTVESLRGLDHSRPLTRIREYLAAMDASPYRGPRAVDPPPRVLAALGPRMLALAAEAADGAHPFSTTPEHTAAARAALGPDKLLCVEQKAVLSRDPDAARAAARTALGVIVGLPSYRACWLRLGFAEYEIDGLENRFVDAVVAHGDEERIRERLRAHLDAGATHVCVQPLDPSGATAPDVRTLEILSPLNGDL